MSGFYFLKQKKTYNLFEPIFITVPFENQLFIWKHGHFSGFTHIPWKIKLFLVNKWL